MTDARALDPTYLRSLRTPLRDVFTLIDRIAEHLDQFDGYVAFSAGKDSLVALHLALQADPHVPVAFFNSGAEFPETLDYLDHLADLWDLNLHIYAAQVPLVDFLATTGLWHHEQPIVTSSLTFRQNLIDHPAAAAHTDHGPGEIWGVRADESHARTLTYRTAHARGALPGQILRNDGTTAYGPIWDHSEEEIWTYIARHDLPTNPVYDVLARIGAPEHLRRVGPMIDGSHLTKGRAHWLKLGWPQQFEHLATVLPRLREYS